MAADVLRLFLDSGGFERRRALALYSTLRARAVTNAHLDINLGLLSELWQSAVAVRRFGEMWSPSSALAAGIACGLQELDELKLIPVSSNH